MTRIAIVHLSDIHLALPPKQNHALPRMPKIADAIRARADIAAGLAHLFVVLSGDLAFSGKKAEYDVANESLTGLLDSLRSLITPETHLLLVPGNHDCNFDLNNSVRQTLLEAVATATIDDAFVAQCTTVQDSFFAFAASYHTLQRSTVRTLHSFQVGDHQVLFQLFNPAGMSSKHETQATLLFPRVQAAAADGIEAAAAVITAFHHPYNWLNANSATDFRTHVEHTSDLIITGHEHRPDRYSKSRREEVTEYLEGGALQGDDPNISDFNLVILDLSQATQTTFFFGWDRDMYVVKETHEPSPFQRNKHRIRATFKLRENHERHLEDPGLPYRHPRKKELTLGDIFVYPHLRESSAETAPRAELNERIITNILEHVVAHKHTIIFGDEVSGKSTLARALFTDLYRRSNLPLLLTGPQFKSPDCKSTHGLLDTAFVETYPHHLLEKYRQLPPERRAIIIDDWHKASHPAATQERIIEDLCNYAGTVVLLASEDYQMSMVGATSPSARLWRFSRATILPFGHEKRYQLVSRWVRLGRHESTAEAESEVSRIVEHTDRTVQKLIGDKLLPSVPALILPFLQALDSPRPAAANLGSFGHLYEAVITESLVSRSTIPLDSKLQFLTEFAFVQHSEEQKGNSHISFQEVYDSYCARYHVRYPQQTLETDLQRSGLFENRYGHSQFKYRYAYFFFVARYFRDNLDREDIRAVVRDLAAHMDHDDSGTILLFLCHLSRDPFVLDTILGQAKQLFADTPVLDLDHPLEILARSYAPRLQLDGASSDEHRLAVRKSRDKLDSLAVDSSTDEQVAIPPKVLELSAARRATQIIGQILRGFPGSIPGERKAELAAECYSLGMRTAHFVVSNVEKHQDAIEELFANMITESRPKLARKEKEAELREVVRRIVSTLCEAACLGSILHVADAIGVEVLERTYDEVLKKDDRLTYRVLDIAIRLDHFGQFPQKELDALERQCGKKVLPRQILRSLVWRYLYLFDTNYRLRHSLCEQFDIKLNSALVDSRAKRVGPARRRR